MAECPTCGGSDTKPVVHDGYPRWCLTCGTIFATPGAAIYPPYVPTERATMQVEIDRLKAERSALLESNYDTRVEDGRKADETIDRLIGEIGNLQTDLSARQAECNTLNLEIARLRALVKAAYLEGMNKGYSATYGGWDDSDTKRALDNQPIPKGEG